MSVGGIVVFALGLICGVGIALYFAGVFGRSDETSSVDRRVDGTEADDSEEASRADDSEEASSDDRGEAIDIEELMGRTEDTDAPASSDSAGAKLTGGGVADGGHAVDGASEGATVDGPTAGSATPSHWLEGISGSVAGKRYLIEEPTAVGRLPRNDLQLNEGDVSRVHCRFRPEGDEVVVEALDTPNGTRVNDREIGPGEPVVLHNEDVVEIGKVLLMYHCNPGGEIPEGLGEESSDYGIGTDVATVTVDTTDWRERIVSELEAAGGDVGVAAQALGMDPEALQRLAEQLEID